MTRISSLFVATTLALLPIGAFAQTTAAPVKGTAPASTTSVTPATTVPDTGKAVGDKMGAVKTTGATAPATATANVAQPAKPSAVTPTHSAKPEVHGMNGASTHHAKMTAPVKAAESAKS